ncbi:MAG: hypothetical protein U0527_08625 [Candidatus Eisenbacteria bacterium]
MKPCRPRFSLAALLIVTATLPGLAWAESDNFESPPVHPAELSLDRTRLFVTHLAGGELIVLDVSGSDPTRLSAIPVGLEPVSCRARSEHEVWVVNHVSDDVSIVDVDRGVVTRTLDVGDEPTDVVFAGGRAFVCVSGRNLLRVFNLSNLDQAPEEIPLSASRPRSLAVSPDQAHVYVSAMDSGNQTTSVPYLSVAAGGGAPPPHPPMKPGLPIPPRVALIVKHDGQHWVDETGHSWDSLVPYRVLDHDVLEISSSTLAVTRIWGAVGTTLLNVAVDPTSGRLWVSNIEALNQVRFVPNLRARFAENRVTSIDPASGLVTPMHLNAHIDYDNPAGTSAERALSLSTPMEIVARPDGGGLYVAAFGSRKIGVLSPAGQVVDRISVGPGPCGLALDQARERLYCYNRMSSTLSVVDLATRESHEVSLAYDPTPVGVRLGRRYHYDGQVTSAHGDLSCGTCHLFGGMDGIAWDLGDPQGDFIPPPGPGLTGDHPMKGPMMTQSMKSLEGTEPLHWRGDRFGLPAFNENFVVLMGLDAPLPEEDFGEYSDFVFSLRYMPNPNRNLDGSLPDPAIGPNPRRGEELFLHGKLFGQAECTICHTIPIGTNTGLVQAEFLRSDQDLKVPQVRNVYEKTGFTVENGEALRGFGFGHDGVFHDIFSFLDFDLFDFRSPSERRDVEAFLLAFHTMTPEAIGAQWTDRGVPELAGEERLAEMRQVADQGLVGLIAKGIDARGETRGWTYRYGAWIADRIAEPDWTPEQLAGIAAPEHPLTYTAVVLGTETRLGIDRDEDGYRDRDEIEAGSDPEDPESTPSPTAAGDAPSRAEPRFELASSNPAIVSAIFRYTLPAPGEGHGHDRRRVGPGGARTPRRTIASRAASCAGISAPGSRTAMQLPASTSRD